MKKFKKVLLRVTVFYPFIDILMLPFTAVAASWFRLIKFIGIKNFTRTKKVLLKVGVMPIVAHYYEPFYFAEQFDQKKRVVNHLQIDTRRQLELLGTINHAHEMYDVPHEGEGKDGAFYYKNSTFSYGDAELYYSVIRHYKPNMLIEIGSGFSTLVAKSAVERNLTQEEVKCKIYSVEPYENDWLEDVGIEVLREKVETMDVSYFETLKKNDILFIDSSHIIRPGGDVLTEIFTILPLLNEGVLIHFHDIFLPKYYPDSWVNDEFRLWNEQYLIEAFLSFNYAFEIVFALNWLMQETPNELTAVFSNLSDNANPSSLWVRKIA